MRRGLLAILVIAALGPATAAARAGTVDVVVTLEQPSLARAVSQSRALSATAKKRRLDLSSRTSVAHLDLLSESQDAVAERIDRRIPGAQVRWRYRIVLNGLAVSLPEDRLRALARVPGVAHVVRGTRYTAAADPSARAVAVPAATAAPLAGDGEGVKVAILDDGVDHRHPYFNPAGYAYPAGFPRGNTAFTTPKVIVARAFAPRSPRYARASLPFDAEFSGHATHVAGIAAGNADTVALGRSISGVAPRAYIGNYKVLTIPTASGLGLNGNSPEIAAGIEAAVADGMDVINLSLGEPEVEPSRDLVTRAVDGAVDAGVVVSISAGNDGDVHGSGSVGSPGSAAKAITVAALATRTQVAAFSSTGPTPLSLRLKPELAAPGVDVLSSVPARQGLWASFSGTSMAAPHVAGYAALLLERRPAWTPLQLKSALVQTAAPISAQPIRAGAGVADVARALDPLLFADPTTVSFGLVRRSETAATLVWVKLGDAGGGAGVWNVSLDAAGDPAVAISVPPTLTVPGDLAVGASAAPAAAPGTHMGYITLTRGSAVRRIPYWLRVTEGRLARHRVTALRRPGVYRGNTAGRPALVDRYRYPERGSSLPGPEQVFRVRLTRPVANFGVAVVGRARGVRVEPRITAAGNEDALVGYASLPFDLNPYQASFGAFRPVAGALLPRAGAYDVVFDTARRADAGRFTFRFWIDDTSPPRLRPLARAVRRGLPLRLRATDPGGSGVDPASLEARIDGRARTATIRRGIVSVDTRGLHVGTHRLALRVSDYQETRNNENVSRILPNTRSLVLRFRVTR